MGVSLAGKAARNKSSKIPTKANFALDFAAMTLYIEEVTGELGVPFWK